jgi:uncharacterized protein (PEP-CTERM system associated)
MTEQAPIFMRWPPRYYRAATLSLTVVLSPVAVVAQEAPQEIAAEAPPRNYWIEPRVAVGLTVENAGGGATGDSAENTLEFSPGVRWVANTARLRGSLDYTLRTLLFTQGGSDDNVQHQLRGNATLNAWDNRAFIDLASVVERRSISALGALPAGSLNNANESETATFLFSPYLRGPLNPSVDYEVRYNAQLLRTAAENRSDINVGSATARLASSQTSRLVGWSVEASSVRVDYSLDRSSRRDSLGGQVSYAVLPELKVFLLAGTETEDIAQRTRESTTNTGLGVDWRPSLRTRAFARLEKRYFGNAHDLILERRTGRTTWRFTDTRNVADSLINAASGSLGSLYEAIDARLALLEPDPVARARLVEAELLRLGLPADTEVFTNLLTSTATVFRTQEFSVILEGTRGLVALSVNNSKSSRLGTVITLGDDFDNGATIRTKGWRVSASHRLTPLTTASLVLDRQSNSISVAGAANTANGLTVGLTTRLGLRTSGEFQLRHTRSDLRDNQTVLSGVLTHRF